MLKVLTDCNVLYLTTPQVSKEKEVADEEERKVAKINEEVSKKQRDCEHDLAKAEPALKAAAEALNTLNKVYKMLFTCNSSLHLLVTPIIACN